VAQHYVGLTATPEGQGQIFFDVATLVVPGGLGVADKVRRASQFAGAGNIGAAVVESAESTIAARIGASSRLVPGGGLMGHEGGLLPRLQGHTVARHVEQSEIALQMRLAAEGNIPAAGSFYSRANAEAAISEVLAARASQIANILDGLSEQEVIIGELSSAPGASLVRGAVGSAPALHIMIVIRADLSLPTGYRIITAYPFIP